MVSSNTVHGNLRMKLCAGVTGVILVLLVWAHQRVDVLPNGLRAEKVLVEKSARKLTLLKQDKPLKVYRVALGRTPFGHKEREGDGRTPEGLYLIDSHKSDSAFHRAMHISYPSSRDVRVAQSKDHSPGGAIMIHGIRNGLGWVGRLHGLVDWTAGCIAVTNWEIEEIWRAVPDGTPIEIRP
jgi:murein L,D-transpeptidase YafK